MSEAAVHVYSLDNQRIIIAALRKELEHESLEWKRARIRRLIARFERAAAANDRNSTAAAA